MFGRFLGSVKKAKTLEVSRPNMEFLGEPTGAGLTELRIEITSRLLQFTQVKNAYLTRLKYQEEESVRICLAVDAGTASERQMQEIADACAGVLQMDIMFLGQLEEKICTQVRAQSQPLFMSGLSLYECPILVTRGTNAEMPDNWQAALVSMYVAAHDLEQALLTAVQKVRADGYEYWAVYEGKVNLIDTQNWWDGFVLKVWPSQASYFPSQERIVALVTTGGHFRGPILEQTIDGLGQA
jgi:hypothetical protein